MLNEKQQSMEIPGITGSTVVVALQIINRLVSSGNVRDSELSAVGTCRDNFTTALEEATGINFDQVRAQQQAAMREAAQRQQQQQSQEPANADGNEQDTAAGGEASQ